MGLTVGELCNRDVIMTSESESVRQAARRIQPEFPHSERPEGPGPAHDRLPRRAMAPPQQLVQHADREDFGVQQDHDEEPGERKRLP